MKLMTIKRLMEKSFDYGVVIDSVFNTYFDKEETHFVGELIDCSEHTNASGNELVESILSEIELTLGQMFSGVENHILLGLFLLKNNVKLLYFDSKLESNEIDIYTLKLRVIEILFSVASYSTNDVKLATTSREDIERAIGLAMEHIRLEKMSSYVSLGLITVNSLDDLRSEKQENEYYHDYDKETQTFLKKNYDIHTYKLQSKDTKKYLFSIKQTESFMDDQLRKLNLYGELNKIDSIADWKRRECIFLNENIGVYDVHKYDGLLNKNLKDHLKRFSNLSISRAFATENTYISTLFIEDILIVDFSVLQKTEQAFRSFMKWEHYDDLIKYYYENGIGVSLGKKYSKLMSYKVADIFESNGYILPISKRRLSNKDKVKVPEVEIRQISHLKVDGDIDVLVYSPFKNILYNIEFKNFQMGVTSANYLKNDLNRGTRKPFVEKAINREEQLVSNPTLVEKLFKGKLKSDYTIRTIILSATPNYHFYIEAEKSDSYDFYNWKEFIELVNNQYM